SDTVELVQDKCRELGIPCSVIGEVTPEQGLTFDGKHIRDQKRIDIDNIYGSFTQKDCIIIALEKAIERALDIGGLVDLIPEVGMNIVYAKPEPSSLDDVAGLSGRIIKAMGKPISCGEVVYGASRHLSSVVLEAMRLGSSKRAAINIRGGNDVEERLEAMGIRVQVLPLKVEGAGCPVAIHLRDAHGLVDAYLHPGDHGIEPTTTILGEDPSRLVDLLEKMM
ncbi:hypothetical protein MCGE09_00589, partial [Thaumarchaeota archaeon SCGC AB-539-E09]